MRQPAIEVQVGGKTYRVVASAEAEVVQRLAGMVDGKLRDLRDPRRATQPQSLLLAALALAHDLEQEQAKRRELEYRAREFLGQVVERIDHALGDGLATESLPPERQ